MNCKKLAETVVSKKTEIGGAKRAEQGIRKEKTHKAMSELLEKLLSKGNMNAASVLKVE